MIDFNIKDIVLIKRPELTGVTGKVIGKSLTTHNKAKIGDLRVLYKTKIRGVETEVTNYFSPDELELLEGD